MVMVVMMAGFRYGGHDEHERSQDYSEGEEIFFHCTCNPSRLCSFQYLNLFCGDGATSLWKSYQK
jgi:hypothetical protein